MAEGMARRPRAAVIGSGFGGLAAAIRLQSAGFDTTVFEARDLPGGRAYVYRQDGFTFDAGPTVITAPGCLAELFEQAGRRMEDYIELIPVEPYYRLVFEGGETFDYGGELPEMLDQIRRFHPPDAAGYLRFLRYSGEVFSIGYEELAATPFSRLSDMVKVAPHLARLRADRSVYGTVSRFVKDERVRRALSFHSLLIGGNPLATSSIYALIPHLERKWGVFFPRGGTGALVEALARLYRELGGVLELGCPVERVELEDGRGRPIHRVTSLRAEREPFDLAVSNADVHATYARLYRGLPAAARRTRRLESLDWSMSLFVLYFGTDRTYEDEVVHHSVLFGARYRELLEEIFSGAALPEDPSLYLHAPTVTDPSMAPRGCGAFYALAPVPHLGNAPLDWDALAGAYGDRVLARLERVLPDLRRHVVTRRTFTPKDFVRELGAYQGSAFSCAPVLSQSAYFRPHNRDPEIPGLYLVGAGTHPGAGVPGVVNSAKATARLIIRDFAGRESIQVHSRSFSLATRMLPADRREDVRVVYAWCRYADDAVDRASAGEAREAVSRLRDELERAYRGELMESPPLAELQRVVRARRIPRCYPEALLDGLAMDAFGYVYRTLEDVLLYGHRVAGTVGLMMTHVFGIDDDRALESAAHLGIAMQLTNICRDVREDWRLGRLYLPDDLLAEEGAGDLRALLGSPLPDRARPPIARVTRRVLEEAELYYRSGDAGMASLPARAAFAVRLARHVYAAIGGRVRRAGCDPEAGRAVVPAWHKLLLMARAAAGSAKEAPLRLLSGARGRDFDAPETILDTARTSRL